MMDNTAFFKARVKMLIKKEKDLAKIKLREDIINRPSEATKSLQKNSLNFIILSQHARKLTENITEFRNLVLDKRKEYILCSSNISSYGNFTYMSEVDRKRFDTDSEIAYKQCLKLINCLKTQIYSDIYLRKSDEFEHLKLVVELLLVYCKEVYRIVLESRNIHKKKSDYLRRISRLANLVGMYETNMEQAKLDEEEQLQRLKSLQEEIEQKKLENNRLDDENIENIYNENVLESNRKKQQNLEQKISKRVSSCEDEYFYDKTIPVLKELTKNEQSQLMVENRNLIERFLHTNSEIIHIEKQMSEIQKLQNTFAEKVMDQERDIDSIHTQTIHTLDNLEIANEFIREAIRNTATRRVISLFCLIVLTFTLLFLDWYNP